MPLRLPFKAGREVELAAAARANASNGPLLVNLNRGKRSQAQVIARRHLKFYVEGLGRVSYRRLSWRPTSSQVRGRGGGLKVGAAS